MIAVIKMITDPKASKSHNEILCCARTHRVAHHAKWLFELGITILDSEHH